MKLLLQALSSSLGLVKDRTVQIILALALLIMSCAYSYQIVTDNTTQQKLESVERLLQDEQLKRMQLQSILLAEEDEPITVIAKN
ncbi:hypothetical protein L4D00_15035 [Photobacterium swingsii]|uniref:hypothetical protein n=1 Tax=Photobacterium swingsii TaxID=680026 RepID=UPI003D122C72